MALTKREEIWAAYVVTDNEDGTETRTQVAGSEMEDEG